MGFFEGGGRWFGEEWIELDWLKEKGYYGIEEFVANPLEEPYGIEEFVANPLEVALRLSCNGKKRGVRLKEKASAAGVAANVYWRKKGCVDWWEKLDASTRKNVFRVILGKSAKSLTAEILKMSKNSSLEDHKSLFSSGADRSMRFKSTMLPQRDHSRTPMNRWRNLPVCEACFIFRKAFFVCQYVLWFVCSSGDSEYFISMPAW